MTIKMFDTPHVTFNKKKGVDTMIHLFNKYSMVLLMSVFAGAHAGPSDDPDSFNKNTPQEDALEKKMFTPPGQSSGQSSGQSQDADQ